MFVLLLLLFLGVIVLAAQSRKNPRMRVPAAILAVAAAALAVFRLFSFAPEEQMAIDLPPEESLGFVLASRVQADHPEGGKVIVFQPNTDAERLLTIEKARMAGIQRVLRNEYEIVARGPQLRYGSMEDREAWFRMETGFPLQAFQQWAAEDGDAVAAISLLGMPVGSLNDTGLPPLYVAELRGVPWDPNRLPSGVAAMVTYRPDRDPDPERTKELLTVFDQTFSVYPPASGSEPEGN